MNYLRNFSHELYMYIFVCVHNYLCTYVTNSLSFNYEQLSVDVNVLAMAQARHDRILVNFHNLKTHGLSHSLFRMPKSVPCVCLFVFPLLVATFHTQFSEVSLYSKKRDLCLLPTFQTVSKVSGREFSPALNIHGNE